MPRSYVVSITKTSPRKACMYERFFTKIQTLRNLQACKSLRENRIYCTSNVSIQPHILTALAVTARQWGKSAWPATAFHSSLSKQFAKRQNTYIETDDEETSESRTFSFTNFKTALHKRKQFLFVPTAITNYRYIDSAIPCCCK